MRVLVTGATGFVGSRLVPELIDAGHDVSVLVRDAADYDPPSGVRVFEGDVLEPGSFETALENCEAVYYLIHSMGGGGDFAERDRRAARNVSRAASAAGVDRVIYLSGLGGDGELSEHLRSRREVEYVLGEGEFDLTALRAAVVIGAESASFRMIRQLADRLPLMVTPEWVRTECQPIAVRDVVSYLVGVLDAPETAGGTYQVGGPEVLTYREMLEETARVLHGRTPLIVPVPVLTPTLSAYWVDLVTDVPADVAHPLIDGLGNRVVVTDDSIEELVPVELTTFEDAVRRAIDEEREDGTRPNHAAGSSDRGAVPIDDEGSGGA
ncbi:MULTISPECIES: NAD(P)H-binding protein [Saliphagus]|uniref:NAD(P)H-binding protein n=1 Tax=Saliphagus infecundisoli TaxID=1849069 RepID=A0ABD5QJV5_9EURY|nr:MULTISPECIES: NAD(P)H-binding protein [Saliphagus]